MANNDITWVLIADAGAPMSLRRAAAPDHGAIGEFTHPRTCEGARIMSDRAAASSSGWAAVVRRKPAYAAQA
jgi:hypothetical protein